jgi:hypothetical protein
MTIYLYKKTHNITGLKYLGKTVSTDPYKYKGSGVAWTEHINQFGYDVKTEIIKECATKEELKTWGEYYSKLWNVVDSDEWANLIEEAGSGGSWSESSKNKLRQTKKQELSLLTKEEKSARIKNSCSSPASWTPTRIDNMKAGMTGKKKTKTPKLLAAIEAKRERSIQNMLRAAEKNRGRTWKLINGKRVWMDEENQNY